MAAKVGQVTIKFAADIAKFESDMKKATKSFNRIGRDFKAAGEGMTKFVTLPLLAVGVASVKMAKDFESSFTGVKKTVTATKEEFAKLDQGFRDMAREIPVSINALHEIGEAAGQLGIETKNILGFTETMAKLGVTTNLSATEAATALARFANITGMAQTDFDRLGSVIVELGNNFATTESEIVAFGVRIAGAGKQVGLSQAEIMGFAAALSSAGVNAEAGGTAISKAFIKINEAVELGGEKLEHFAAIAGKSTEEFSKLFKEDAAEAMTLFIEGLGRLKSEGGSALLALDALGMNQDRLRMAMLNTAGAGDMLRESIAAASAEWIEMNALNKEAAQRFATFESQLQLVKTEFKLALIELGEELIPILRDDVIPLVKDFAIKLQDLAKWFGGLSPEAKKTALAFAAIAAAVGPALIAIGHLSMGIGAMIPLITKATVWLTGGKGLVGAITNLGVAAGVAGAIFAGWKIGEWIDSMDLFGRHAARATNEIYEQAKALKEEANALGIIDEEMAKHKKALDEGMLSAKAYKAIEKTLFDQRATEGIEAYRDRMEKLVAEYKKAHPELSAIKTGTDAVTEATEAAAEITDEIARLTREYAEDQKNLNKVLVQAPSHYEVMLELQEQLKEDLAKGIPGAIKVSIHSFQTFEKSIADFSKSASQDMYEFESNYLRDMDSIGDAQMKADWQTEIFVDEWEREHGRAGDATNDFGKLVGDTLDHLTEDIRTKVKAWAGPFGDFAAAALDAVIKGFAQPFMNVLTGLGNAAGNWFSNLLSGKGGGFNLGGLLDFGGGGSGGGFNIPGLNLGGLFSGLFSGGGGAAIPFIGPMAPGFVGPMSSGVSGASGGILGPVGAAIGKVGTAITSGLSAVGSAIGAGMNAIWAGLSAAGPVGWAAMAGAGAFFGGRALADWASGPNSYEALEKEIARDYGGVDVPKEVIAAFLDAVGISEAEAWDVRKNISTSPAFLLGVVGKFAEEQGKIEEFLQSLEKVQTSWGNFDFRAAFEEGLNTDDWTALNDMWKNISDIGSGSITKLADDFEGLLLPELEALADDNEALADSAKQLAVENEKLEFATIAADESLNQFGLTVDEFRKKIEAAHDALASITPGEGGNYMRPRGLGLQGYGDQVARAQENQTYNVRGGSVNLSFAINASGGNAADLEQAFRSTIIPLIQREVRGGPSGLREDIRYAVKHTERAY